MGIKFSCDNFLKCDDNVCPDADRVNTILRKRSMTAFSLNLDFR